MAAPVTLSDDTAYVTKQNIQYPGTSAQATAAEGRAEDRIEDSIPGLTVTVAAGSAVVET